MVDGDNFVTLPNYKYIGNDQAKKLCDQDGDCEVCYDRGTNSGIYSVCRKGTCAKFKGETNGFCDTRVRNIIEGFFGFDKGKYDTWTTIKQVVIIITIIILVIYSIILWKRKKLLNRYK